MSRGKVFTFSVHLIKFILALYTAPRTLHKKKCGLPASPPIFSITAVTLSLVSVLQPLHFPLISL